MATDPTPMGSITAPPERTFVFTKAGGSAQLGVGLPLGTPTCIEALDPSDLAEFAFDFSALLATGVTIENLVQITMSAGGAAVGVQVESDAPRQPILDATRTTAQIWLSVDEGYQQVASFLAAGVPVGISILFRTDQNPFQEFERTGILIVRQQ